jgi:hypothetical protein
MLLVFSAAALLVLTSSCKKNDKASNTTEQTVESSQQEVGTNMAASQDKKPIEYIGLSPKQALPKVQLYAKKWDKKAVFQALFANKWEFYGDPLTRKMSSIEIPEWRFIFVTNNKIASFVVSQDSVILLKEEDKPISVGSTSPLAGPPINKWIVDIGAAVITATKNGNIVSDGPFLFMRKLPDKVIPVWTIPVGQGSIFVDAVSGNILDMRDIN